MVGPGEECKVGVELEAVDPVAAQSAAAALGAVVMVVVATAQARKGQVAVAGAAPGLAAVVRVPVYADHWEMALMAMVEAVETARAEAV